MLVHAKNKTSSHLLYLIENVVAWIVRQVYLSHRMTSQTPDETIVAEQKSKTVKKRSPLLVLGIGVIVVLLLSAAGAFYYLKQKDDTPPNGERVYSKADGSVKQVEDYVKQKFLSDPDSFRPIHWTKLQKTNVFGIVSYKVGLVYKGKNKNKELLMDSKIFELDEMGQVLFVMDTGPMNNK
jgi:flagellar basal body-associated protein FliL